MWWQSLSKGCPQSRFLTTQTLRPAGGRSTSKSEEQNLPKCGLGQMKVHLCTFSILIFLKNGPWLHSCIWQAFQYQPQSPSCSVTLSPIRELLASTNVWGPLLPLWSYHSMQVIGAVHRCQRWEEAPGQIQLYSLEFCVWSQWCL